MRLTTNAGLVSNALTCVRGMARSTPRVSPSGTRPRGLTCPAPRGTRGVHGRLGAMRVPPWSSFVRAGLACLHRLGLAFPVGFVEVGACGMRLVCLVWAMTGCTRLVGAAFGTQHQVNRHVDEAMVASRRAVQTAEERRHPAPGAADGQRSPRAERPPPHHGPARRPPQPVPGAHRKRRTRGAHHAGDHCVRFDVWTSAGSGPWLWAPQRFGAITRSPVLSSGGKMIFTSANGCSGLVYWVNRRGGLHCCQ
jgi:hypothetical protein